MVNELQGCTLKNTEWVIGVAIYTGRQTKICMQESGRKYSRKKGRVDRLLDLVFFSVFVLLLVLCIIGAIAGCVLQVAKLASPHE